MLTGRYPRALIGMLMLWAPPKITPLPERSYLFQGERGKEQKLAIQKEWTGQDSAVRERKNVVIRTRERWQTTWNRMQAKQTPRPALPNVDFKKQMVLAAFLGQKNTGGYTIRIERVAKAGASVRVYVRETHPYPGSITTQAVTSPFAIVVVPSTKGRVTFVDSKPPSQRSRR